MTTTEDQAAIAALDFLAQTDEQVAGFYRYLRSAADAHISPIHKVVSDVACRRYQSGLMVEIWIEAYLSGDRTLTWWMDIIPRDGSWVIDARVTWEGRDTGVELPEQVLADFHTVRRAVPGVLDELFNVGKQMLVPNLAP